LSPATIRRGLIELAADDAPLPVSGRRLVASQPAPARHSEPPMASRLAIRAETPSGGSVLF
jgi:hypothetical protein